VTLRRVIRRVLRVLATLAVVSVIAFWGIAQLGPHTPGFARNPFRELPLFANPNPRGAPELAHEAVISVARNDHRSDHSRQTLVRLGGAALPYVLPKLDTLDPVGRARVAVALGPIALRMGLAEAEDVSQPERAMLFWNRFWQDRAVDFRPPVVKRLVTRVAEHSLSLRREDVLHLDTFALEDLIRALGTVREAADVQRVRRVSAVLSHITGRPVLVGPNAGVSEARAAVESWKSFWLTEGSQYTALDGARRLAAIATETQYGKWCMLVLDARLGRTLGGEAVLDLLGTRLPITSLLLATVLLSALGLLSFVRARTLRLTRLAVGRCMPELTAELPLLLTATVCLEVSLGVRGAFAAAASALGGGDVNAWMALTLALSFAVLSLCALLEGAFSPAWARLETEARPL
jgi:peptide/nickel transport system permease protein